MFGSLANLITPPPVRKDPPENVPPPTPINFPRCLPQVPGPESSGPSSSAGEQSPHLTTILQSLVRPPDQVNASHLEALGVHVNPDASLDDLIPDSSRLPNFARWDLISLQEAHALDAESQQKLCNGRMAPGVAKYQDLRQGLLTENAKAFRAVKRVSPRPGEKYLRLGYCHGFFLNLEALTMFWDDTSDRNPSDQPHNNPATEGDVKGDETAEDENYSWYRTDAGTAMPPHFRTNLISSFLKLVTYDFSCSIMSRQDPRLYIKAPRTPPSSSSLPAQTNRHSYFSSGCNFIFRMASDIESAKRSIVEGPIAAVSPRHTTSFPPVGGNNRESVIDLAREIIAALITAQHRAREDRKEERIGEGAWWATKPRWGGGPGGPIGKESEALESKDATPLLVGDKDAPPVSSEAATVEGSPPEKSRWAGPSEASCAKVPTGSSARKSQRPSSSSRNPAKPPNPKRPRKGLAIYDAYRMIRAPSFHWDPKTKYEAIGRQRGVDYDDVFVISSLFHHISVLRFRVPDRLLEVLDGAVPDDRRERGCRLEAWRTRWLDFFVPEDRVEALRVVWGVVAYVMRSVEVEGEDMEVDGDGDGKSEGEGEGKDGLVSGPEG